MSLSPEDIEDIVAILDSTAYDELQLSTDRFSLTLRRYASGWSAEHELRNEPEPVQGPDVETSAATKDQPDRDGQEPPEPASASAPEGHPVLAPLPGVFYRAPKPGAAPFVSVGEHVEADTVVAIIETMKLMNAVHAGASGTVSLIVAENDAPIEQGDVLLWLALDPPP